MEDDEYNIFCMLEKILKLTLRITFGGIFIQICGYMIAAYAKSIMYEGKYIIGITDFDTLMLFTFVNVAIFFLWIVISFIDFYEKI